MKRTFLMIRNQILYICFVIIVFVIIAFGYKNNNIVTNDISSSRSVNSYHLVSKYKKELVVTKTVETFEDVLKYAKEMPVKFDGIMTGYGPDCVGCGGRTGCPPRQNVKNGNVYFEDQTYGKINIVATDKRIPCGSIIEITNSTLGDKVMAIALDRGEAIKNNKMDFLVETEKKASKNVGKQKVTYEIIRWGW